jgi:hypothetical protein
MDDVAWGALALALTLCSGLYTWTRARTRSAAAFARWSGITLLPLAAYFTHTLRLLSRIGTAITNWATGFVWNPMVWLGLVLAVIAVVLIGVSTRLPGAAPRAARSAAPKQVKAPKGKAPAGADLGLGDDLDDIEAILKKHGIS